MTHPLTAVRSALRLATVLSLCAFTAQAGAQATQAGAVRIYRCGNTYTNDPVEAKAPGCKLMEGGNITVVEGTRVQNPQGVKLASATPSVGAPGPAPAAPAASTRVDSADQRARDADARRILESELRKAEQQRDTIKAEYNNGEPEKRAQETRNHQKYLDRVAELKASLTRAENDITGIRRELDRLNPAR